MIALTEQLAETVGVAAACQAMEMLRSSLYRTRHITEAQPDARAWATDFFQWYNYEHHHSALGLFTRADVHFGRANSVLDRQQQVLQTAYLKNPERFVKGPSIPASLPFAVWINPPQAPTPPDEPRLSSS